MPSVSKSQRALFAIAEHHPEELYAKNKALAGLPHKTLHEFAATKSGGLPEHVKPKKTFSGTRRIRVRRNKDLIPI